MTQPMPGNRPKTLKMNWIFVGCFVPCGLGSYGLLAWGWRWLIALAYTFFARQEWSSTAITDRPTVNMLGDITRSSNFCVT